MRLNLPKNTPTTVSGSVVYENATLASTHSNHVKTGGLYAVGGDVQYTMPRIWDPSNYGMAGDTRQMSGFDILRFDDDPSVRQHVLLGLRNIAKTHPTVRACYLPGTMVRTMRGCIPIENVEKGDEVITHLGNVKNVTDSMELAYSGEMRHVETMCGNIAFDCTADHMLYVYRRTGTTKYLGVDGIPDGQYMWVAAKDLLPNDYLVSPMANETIEPPKNIDAVCEHEYLQKGRHTYGGTRYQPDLVRHTKTSLEFDVTEDFFRFVGYFVADGSTWGHHYRSTAFYFSSEEQGYVDDVCDIIRNVFDIEPKVIYNAQGKNMTQVTFNSVAVGTWLHENCCGFNGDSSPAGKHIPTWMLLAPKNYIRQLLLGMFRADGTFTDDTDNYSSVSYQLIDAVSFMLTSFGIKHCVRYPRGDFEDELCTLPNGKTTRRRKIGHVSVTGRGHELLSMLFDMPREKGANAYRHSLLSQGFVGNGYMHRAVKLNEAYEFSGKVYNIDVEGDHSYIADGVATHNCVEVYSRYPLQGLKLQHSNSEYERFFTELFLEDLDFENFLTDVGKSFWIDGTAFVYGNWNDELGLWVGEDILDPLCMDVRRIPLMGEDSIYMVPTDDMKALSRGQSPEGRLFQRKFPEMAQAIASGRDILMSSDRVTMIANKDRPSDLWGTPVMLRCWNILRLEDRMNSAMQATADRLYAPLVMFTVGGNLPDGTQYIPSAAALDAFRANLDAALSSDFRAIVTHSGVQAQEVIRSDRVSNFKNDMEMYDDRIFMAWGLSPSILKPQNANYATTALEFQLVSQMLSSYQKVLSKVYEKQAAFVAEANELYEYEKKGDELKPVYERREVWDSTAGDGEGAYVVKDVPKLAIPKLHFDVVNFRNEQQEREFLQALRQQGIPIADDDIAIGVDINLEDSAEKVISETKKKKLDESRMNLAIFRAALEQDLPIPPDVRSYMEAAIPPEEYQALVEKYRGKASQGAVDLGTEIGDSGDLGVESFDGEEGGVTRPPESDEQRAGMPVA